VDGTFKDLGKIAGGNGGVPAHDLDGRLGVSSWPAAIMFRRSLKYCAYRSGVNVLSSTSAAGDRGHARSAWMLSSVHPMKTRPPATAGVEANAPESGGL
jgi:hypothetical protein